MLYIQKEKVVIYRKLKNIHMFICVQYTHNCFEVECCMMTPDVYIIKLYALRLQSL